MENKSHWFTASDCGPKCYMTFSLIIFRNYIINNLPSSLEDIDILPDALVFNNSDGLLGSPIPMLFLCNYTKFIFNLKDSKQPLLH